MNANRYHQQLEPVLRTLPDNPGVYQYYDESGILIYVGKAKNLKKRVLSYFNKDLTHSGKVRVLVSKIAEIRTIVVETELDALLLENNLIKKHQPRYNVMLKDDKTYPWICIKNEAFPRVFSTRKLIRDGSLYFGPYASIRMMNTLLELIRQLFQLRNCSLNLSPKQIEKSRYKVCLQYHIKQCKGPCEGLQTEEDYRETIDQIKTIIKGNISLVINELKDIMMNYASKMEFEKAQIIKEKIELLEKYQSRSAVVSPTIVNADALSIVTDEQSGYVNFLKVFHGAVVQSHTIELKKKLDEAPEELLEMALIDLRQRFDSDAHEIILPFKLDLEIPGITFTVPKIGDKKKLLELSERNVKYYILEKQKQKDLVDPERHTRRIMTQMMKDLHMNVEPRHIECFDNSNIQGEYPVAAMVVFRNGKPFKKDYRHFNIKTVEGPNDFASMEEIVYRRYHRMSEEKQELPQLIVIDGGKGQLGAAMNSLLKLGLTEKIKVVGIAKRLEELYFPGDPTPLYLDKKSESLKIIQHIRDEAHRFGITHHRKRREKGTIKTELTEIQGIGSTISEKLLRQFKSVKNIRKASLEELIRLIGKSKATLVWKYFQAKER